MSTLKFAIADAARRSGLKLYEYGRVDGFKDRELLRIALHEFGLRLDPARHFHFIQELDFARTLSDVGGVRFYLSAENEVIAKTRDFEVIVETREEFFILHEILIAGVYNFEHPRPAVVLDVGMNTGFASLSFAARNNVVAVHAYEPFPKTYHQGERNLRLNPTIAKKISPRNCGLGASDRTVAVEYCYDWKGSVGINGVPQHRREGQTISTEELVLTDICEAVDSLVSAFPDVDVVAKIDCEGSEYELIQRLSAVNKLRDLKIIMIEWHQNGPDELIENLVRSQFSAFSFVARGQGTGLIYAIRN